MLNVVKKFVKRERIYFVSLNKDRLESANEHSFNLFEAYINKYKFRIGSRSWQVVPNTEPAMSYTQTLQSLGILMKAKSNAISFTTYPRTQNIHIFDFEKVHDETHSGEDTTNGRNLKMEIEFNAIGEVGLVDDNGRAVNDADGNPLLLKRAMNPNQSVVYLYQQFTRMINISGDGIAVTE